MRCGWPLPFPLSWGLLSLRLLLPLSLPLLLPLLVFKRREARARGGAGGAKRSWPPAPPRPQRSDGRGTRGGWGRACPAQRDDQPKACPEPLPAASGRLGVKGERGTREGGKAEPPLQAVPDGTERSEYRTVRTRSKLGGCHAPLSYAWRPTCCGGRRGCL
jgi:hypothetical protein